MADREYREYDEDVDRYRRRGYGSTMGNRDWAYDRGRTWRNREFGQGEWPDREFGGTGYTGGRDFDRGTYRRDMERDYGYGRPYDREFGRGRFEGEMDRWDWRERDPYYGGRDYGAEWTGERDYRMPGRRRGQIDTMGARRGWERDYTGDEWAGRGGMRDYDEGGMGRGYRGDYSTEGRIGRRFDRGRAWERDEEWGGRQEWEPTSWSYTEYWWVPGPLTGVGPEGWQRSIDRIVEDVNERLTQHGQLDARNIRVECQGNTVVLRGQVPSRREKRMAEDVAESVSGVADVRNELTIEQQGQAERGGMAGQQEAQRDGGQTRQRRKTNETQTTAA